MLGKGKFFGSVLIAVGTGLGAGMLALPIVSAQAGFIWAVILLLVIWFLTTASALLVLEVNLAFREYENSFDTMATKTLGTPGKIAVWISCLLLLYSLDAAYISGSSSLLTVLFKTFLNLSVPAWLNSILFTAILGGVVFWGTAAVDYINRGLVSIKGLLLITTLIFLLPHIDMHELINSHHLGRDKYLVAAAPVFSCAFAFHIIIPTIRNYVGNKPKVLRSIIIYGTTIPLVIYFLWLLVHFGIVPLIGQHSFASLRASHQSVGGLINTVGLMTHNKGVALFMNGFSNVAMTTSFLGVSLSLFDFLADGCKRLNNRRGRFQTSLLTFTPPLLFAIFYPQGFVVALGYAAIFVAILMLILPALMVYVVRRKKLLTYSYHTFGGIPLLLLICGAGVAIIVMQLITSFNV